jgi:hypothetical protein
VRTFDAMGEPMIRARQSVGASPFTHHFDRFPRTQYASHEDGSRIFVINMSNLTRGASRARRSASWMKLLRARAC